MVENLQQKLKQLPDKPGVYVMLDANNDIIYIGKAKVLKNRVRQYFQSGKNLTDKVIAMVNKINDFYYYIVNSESDALLLESNLIKKYKPQYNILLKDDKNYPYVKIDKTKPFPKVEIVRKIKKDGANYYGPYIGGVPVKDLLNVIYEGFHVRSCNIDINRLPKNFRPCLECQIGRCVAPCDKRITEEEYAELIKKVERFLKGDTEEVEELLTQKMLMASQMERFERAIDIRNMLKIVQKIKEKKLSALAKTVDMDVFTISTNGRDRVINHLMVRQGIMQGGENYNIVDFASYENEVLSSFIVQFFQNVKIPEEIIAPLSEEEANSVKEALKNLTDKSFNVISPKMGLRKSLVELSLKNGADYMEKSVDDYRRKENMTVKACEQLASFIGVQKIRRMECYDISNISGVDKVSSMVVFHDGEKTASHYRRFKIKTVEGANDYASHQEMMRRRLAKLGTDEEERFPKPDLVIIDGGKGQLSAVKEVFDEYGITDIELISLAERDEEIFTLFTNESIRLDRRDYALKVLQRIRDEAHRFAITYFRNLHSKRNLASLLQEIDGIGKKKQLALMQKFGTIDRIMKASQDELCQVDGIGAELAKKIQASLKGGL